MIPPVQDSSHHLALPLALRQEEKESNNMDQIKTKHSEPLDAYENIGNNQDPTLASIDDPEIHQLLDLLWPEKKLTSENTDLEEHSLSLEDQKRLECGMDSKDSFADGSTLVDDIQLSQLFSSIEDCDQCKGSSENMKDPEVIILDDLPEKTDVIPPDKCQKKKHKFSEPSVGAPKAKFQAKTLHCLLGEEQVIGEVAASDRALGKTTKQSISKTPRTASGRSSRAKGHRQEKTRKTQEHQAKKAKDTKQAGGKTKAEEEKTPNRGMKRKMNPPELSQEAVKKPQTCLGLHMVESVQVFHALGKKTDKKTEPNSTRALGKWGNIKDTQPSLRKPWLDTPWKRNMPEKIQVRAAKPNNSAEKEGSSPSQYELPPPGKVKLVPLPFLTMQKPPGRPVRQRPQSLALHRSASAHPARPGSTKPFHSTAAHASLPSSASGRGPVISARPTSTNPARAAVTNPSLSSITQVATPRPVSSKISSCLSIPQEPVPTEASKRPCLPGSQHQCHLQDFSRQPFPWRKPDVPGPVMTKPIMKEQRPEREAMKSQAPRERKNAVQHTSLGRMQSFIEREKEMDISL